MAIYHAPVFDSLRLRPCSANWKIEFFIKVKVNTVGWHNPFSLKHNVVLGEASWCGMVVTVIFTVHKGCIIDFFL